MNQKKWKKCLIKFLIMNQKMILWNHSMEEITRLFHTLMMKLWWKKILLKSMMTQLHQIIKRRKERFMKEKQENLSIQKSLSSISSVRRSFRILIRSLSTCCFSQTSTSSISLILTNQNWPKLGLYSSISVQKPSTLLSMMNSNLLQWGILLERAKATSSFLSFTWNSLRIAMIKGLEFS